MVTHPFLLVKQWNRIWSQFFARQPRRRIGRVNSFDGLRIGTQIESLEQRSMLSAANFLTQLHATTTFEVLHQGTSTYQVLHHSSPATSVIYTPSQIQAAYGFNKISGDGTGQTVAIVDAYDDPTIAADLQLFDSTFSLAGPPSLTVVSQTGSTTHRPSTDPSKGWEVEESLDVEWVHALAPGAKIVLVEANSSSDADLFTAVATAANLPGVSVVSMSFGGGEFSTESSYDSVFTTPSGHQGVTFFASTGDNGAPGGFPAYSSNVVAVGGTTLNADSSGNYISESGWSGSGGGISPYETKPSYQNGIVTQSSTNRTIPDVSFDADPNSGVYVVDSFTNGSSNPWMALGGTSFAAPAWGAIMSIVDQGRVANGLGTLDGATQTLPLLYQLSQTNSSAFHDVTTGNNGHAAGTGYDLVTGLGSPVVNVLTAAMEGSGSGGSGSGGSGSGGSGSGGSGGSSTSQLIVQHAPTSATAGIALTALTIDVENQSGQIIKTDSSTVTLTLSSGTFSTGQSIVTATAVKGVATFNGVIIDAAGTYTLTVSDASMTTSTTNVTINPAAARTPVWQTAPTSSQVAGTAFSPVIVEAEDAFGNLVSATATVSIKITGGKFFNGSTTISATTSAGIATFSNLIVNAVGSYTLTANIGLQATSGSNITVSPGAASKLVWQTVPEAAAVAGASLNAIVVAVEDPFGNVVTSDNSTVTLTLSSGTFSTGSSTATATAVHGIASFSGLSINTSGTYKITASDSGSLTTVTSGNVVISPSTLSSLAIQQNPTTGTAGMSLSPTVKVEALDQFGNLIKISTTVTLTLSGANFSTGASTVTANTSAGIATFSHLIINQSGTFTLTPSVESLTAPSFNVVINPAAAKLPVWQTPPSASAVAGTALSTILVDAEDVFGNLVSNPANVTLRLTGGKFSDGTTSVLMASNSGVSTFSNLTINTAGNYTLTAYIGSAATSSVSLTVSAAAASQLVWKAVSSGKTVAGTTLNTVQIAAEDAYGNVVKTDTSTVTLTLSSGTFSTSLSTATATAINGIASFNNLVINATGTYQMTASDAELTTVNSGNFVVIAASLSSLAIVQNPTTGTAGTALSPAVQVQVLDQFGNLVTTSTSVTLTLSGGTFSNKSTTVTATASKGIATFSNLMINVAGNYSLTASASGVTGPSFSVAISPSPASKLVWQAAPDASVAAGASMDAIVVVVQDAYGNVITTDTSTLTLTLSRGTFTNGSSTISMNAVDGVATFSDVAITAAGSYKIITSDSVISSRLTSSGTTVTAAS